MPDSIQQNATAEPWKEIGLAVDEESGLAALVFVQTGPKSLPSIQLGKLIGADRTFSPYLHPSVRWEQGRGSVVDLGPITSIPSSLAKKIADMLAPHLVEQPPTGPAAELMRFDLLEVEHPGGGETALSCLRCS